MQIDLRGRKKEGELEGFCFICRALGWVGVCCRIGGAWEKEACMSIWGKHMSYLG